LFNDVLEQIVQRLHTPVLAITGNHDSSIRLSFASDILKEQGLHIVGKYDLNQEPVVLEDEFGKVYFHLIPYTEPGDARLVFHDDSIETHDDLTEKIIEQIKATYDEDARHVYVGHAFVTPGGEERENTSDSERPLTIGGVEYVSSERFLPFHYVALGHLHRAHYVTEERIRYSGSILKYSHSEEHHKKGFYIVELDGNGEVSIEKRELIPRRDLYTVKATLAEILTMERTEDYVFVELEDEEQVLFPMEQIRTVFPNAMHVTTRSLSQRRKEIFDKSKRDKARLSDPELFVQFYEKINGQKPTAKVEQAFTTMLERLYEMEREARSKTNEEV